MKLERQFSKEIAGDLRKETAEKLIEARSEPTSYSELKNGLSEDKRLPGKYETFTEVKVNFESIKKDIWGNIFKTESYKERELYLNQVLKQIKEDDIARIQNEYDQELQKILKKCPLTKEEKEKYLKTESMEKMEIDDYLTLLKRLSGEAFYHVTRYGVRENTFMSTGGGHTEGKGSFVDGFIPLLLDGNIQSFTSTLIKDNSNADKVINEEGVMALINKGKSAVEIADEIVASLKTDYSLDRESSHFSYGKDLNHMYGGEKDYKFYVYYPVEYILENDFYQKTRESQINLGQGYYNNRGGINQQYNDFEIFNFGKGVPINAGILCITGNLNVDPETGSQYKLKDGKPVMNEKGEYKKAENTITSREYWENYFKVNPDIKPSKIIYSNFSTNADGPNQELHDSEKSKNIYYQDEEKSKEFDEYAKSSRIKLKNIFTNIIRERFFGSKE